jgi:hypothetical protein
VLQGIIGVVKQPQSGQMIQMAMQKLQQQIQQAPPNMKPEQAAQARMMAIMPVLTQLTAQVTSQFQFEGGFMQAVMSIQKAATEAKDSELMQNLMPLKELVTGENPAKTKVWHKLRTPFAHPLRCRQSFYLIFYIVIAGAHPRDGQARARLCYQGRGRPEGSHG